MEKKDVERFEKLHIQIKDMYSELSILSKKSPDGAINKFKLNFINQLIEEANQLLGKRYMPFSDFQRFQEDDMPFNSDVVLIISQYIKCLEKFKYDVTSGDVINTEVKYKNGEIKAKYKILQQEYKERQEQHNGS